MLQHAVLPWFVSFETIAGNQHLVIKVWFAK